jgi:hypothetical protein
MEGNAVPVLGMGEDMPATRLLCVPRLSAQISLNAAVIATAVIAKLTQGPQSIAPAMIVNAKRGKNDLPSTCLVFEEKPGNRRTMLRSFPVTFSRG